MLRIALLLILAAPGLAEDSSIAIPLRHLKLKAPLTEGQRGLGDTFPYIAFGKTELTPGTLGDALRADIDSKEAAFEAARLFAAGPLVRDEAQAKRIIATGRTLAKKLKHLRVKLHEYRPKSYAPTVEKLKTGWQVSLVVFEMDRMLRLVHIEATVRAGSKITLKRTPIVDGPMTVWQTAMIAGASQKEQDAALQKQHEMRAEALLARRTYARALAPRCNLDTAWAIARLRLSATQLEDLWGPHDRVVGSGVYLVARDLADGGAIIYDAGDKARAIRRVAHVREAPAPMRVGPTLHQLAR